MLDIDIIGRHAQFGPDDLGEGRFMSLALRLHADARNRLAGWMHTNLAAIEHLDTCDIEVLAGASADDLGEAGDTDAH